MQPFSLRCQSQPLEVMRILRAQIYEVVRTVGICPRWAAPRKEAPRSRIFRVARPVASIPSRWREVAQIAAVLGFVVPLSSGLSAKIHTEARAARSERLSITAHLDYVDAKGAYLIESGSGSGPLAGSVKARIRVAADISGSFTFYPRGGGSISGSGVGSLRESGRYASFSGTVTVLGGTGHYVHARGGGRLYGVYNRNTLGVTIQTTGSLTY